MATQSGLSSETTPSTTTEPPPASDPDATSGGGEDPSSSSSGAADPSGAEAAPSSAPSAASLHLVAKGTKTPPMSSTLAQVAIPALLIVLLCGGVAAGVILVLPQVRRHL